MGVTLAVLQSSGIKPFRKDFVKSIRSGWTNSSWISRSNLDDNASFPGDLSDLNKLNFFLIISSLISRVVKVSASDPVKIGLAVGTFAVSSLVNTDEKYSLNSSASSCGVSTGCPVLASSGPTFNFALLLLR